MSKDARIAALQSMAGTLQSAAELVHSKCAVTSGCLKDGVSDVELTVGGATGYVRYGYPIDTNRSGYIGIQQVVNVSGFTHIAEGNPAHFDKDGAPTPSACRVTYTYQQSHTPPVITTTTDGC